MSETLINHVKENEELLKQRILKYIRSSYILEKMWASIIAPNILAPFPHGYISITIFFEMEVDKEEFISSEQAAQFEQFCQTVVLSELSIENINRDTPINIVYDSEQNVIENHGGDFTRNLR